MPGVAVCAGVVAEEAGLFMVCLGTHWGLPPVLFAFWHWRFGPVEGRGVQRSGRGRSRVSAANVLWGSCPEPVGPQRSGGRGLARSGPPATIGGPERQNHRQGPGRVSGTCRVGHGSAISPTGVQLV